MFLENYKKEARELLTEELSITEKEIENKIGEMNIPNLTNKEVDFISTHLLDLCEYFEIIKKSINDFDLIEWKKENENKIKDEVVQLLLNVLNTRERFEAKYLDLIRSKNNIKKEM